MPDIVAADPAAVHSALNLGGGSFGTPSTQAIPGSTGSALTLADMDSDGKLDVVMNTRGSVAIFFGKGDGTFDVDQSYATAIASVWSGFLLAMDLNGDGRPDIVTVTGDAFPTGRTIPAHSASSCISEPPSAPRAEAHALLIRFVMRYLAEREVGAREPR
jgi:hypothetical protein